MQIPRKISSTFFKKKISCRIVKKEKISSSRNQKVTAPKLAACHVIEPKLAA